MENNNFMYCSTVDELIACASLPLHAYPTIEFAVKNVDCNRLRSDDVAVVEFSDT